MHSKSFLRKNEIGKRRFLIKYFLLCCKVVKILKMQNSILVAGYFTDRGRESQLWRLRRMRAQAHSFLGGKVFSRSRGFAITRLRLGWASFFQTHALGRKKTSSLPWYTIYYSTHTARKSSLWARSIGMKISLNRGGVTKKSFASASCFKNPSLFDIANEEYSKATFSMISVNSL